MSGVKSRVVHRLKLNSKIHTVFDTNIKKFCCQLLGIKHGSGYIKMLNALSHEILLPKRHVCICIVNKAVLLHSERTLPQVFIKTNLSKAHLSAVTLSINQIHLK